MFTSLFNRRSLSLALVSLLATTSAAEVFESLPDVPAGWHFSRSPSGAQPLKLQLGLSQKNPEGFENALIGMSTPGHRDYGKHYQSHDEMKRMLQPHDESVDAVHQWLAGAGISDFSRDADWVTFYTTVARANALLEANFQWYINDATHAERLRTLEYSIPDSLRPHVNLVTPTTRFGQLHAQHATKHSKAKAADEAFKKEALSGTADCNNAITPQCIKDIYAIGDHKAKPEKGNKIAFASFLDQYARQKDLDLFTDRFAQSAKGTKFNVIKYNGGKDDQDSPADSSEANLDLQYIVGVSAPVPVTEFSTAGRAPLVPDLDQPDPNHNDNEPYLDFLQNVVKMKNEDLPQVISTSYGEDEQSVPEKYARSVCNLYAQLGSRGVSVIFSSGDSGVGAACQTNDGKNTTHFPPQFPAACPFVTSVGATTGVSPERGVFFSSGGFSDLWDRPKWQEEAVGSFLHGLGDQWSGMFNPKGRAFPDVAAQGQNFAVYEKGNLNRVDGTSAAAPVFAGIIALLNDARLGAGQPPLGFLNPWLYSNGGALNDITEGGSTGCNGRSRFGGDGNGGPVVPYASWNSTKGWDPVTGLGTPDLPKMLKAASISI
ncbi:Peptidase S8/S53 subtilisin/kexin/sedolisin, partial [Penicillium capsulatum]